MIELDGEQYRRDRNGDWGRAIDEDEVNDWSVSFSMAAALSEIERLQAILDQLVAACTSRDFDAQQKIIGDWESQKSRT